MPFVICRQVDYIDPVIVIQKKFLTRGYKAQTILLLVYRTFPGVFAVFQINFVVNIKNVFSQRVASLHDVTITSIALFI